MDTANLFMHRLFEEQSSFVDQTTSNQKEEDSKTDSKIKNLFVKFDEINRTRSTALQPSIAATMVCEGDIVAVPQVTQTFAKKIQSPPNSKAGVIFSSCLISKDLYLRSIIKDLASEPGSQLQSRAYMALFAVDHSYPGLRTLQNSATKLMLSTTPQQREKAIAGLERTLISHSDTFEVNFPIKRNLIQRTSLFHTSHIEKVNNNRKKTDLKYWKLNNIAINRQQIDYALNLHQVSILEGFKLTAIPFPWPRDKMFTIHEKKYILPARIKITNSKSYLRASLASMSDKFRYATLVWKLLGDKQKRFQGLSSVKASEFSHSHLYKEAPFFFEGGNLLRSLDQKGETIILSGASNILVSILNSRFFFSDRNKKKNLIISTNRILENSGEHEVEIKKLMDRLQQAQLLEEFSEPQKRKVAALTIASIPMIEKEMSAILGSKVVTLGEVFEHQPAYHLDMFLMPAPDGQVYIQDHSMSIHVLEAVRENYGANLNSDELDLLTQYLSNARTEHEEQQDLLAKITYQLESCNIKVIPVPGSYSIASDNRVNFLNAIVGIGNTGKICITNGASGKLGQYLADAFTSTLTQNGFDSTYFIGRKTTSKLSDAQSCRFKFAAAEASLKSGGGIHCRTQVMPDAPEGYSETESKAEEFDSLNELYIGDALKLFYSEMIQSL